MADHPWDRRDPLARVAPETHAANMALRDYHAMGPARSLDRLAARYQSDTKPTPLRTLKGWSTRFAWQARVEALDVAYSKRLAEAEITERLKARRERIRTYEMLRGVAVEHLKSVRDRPGDSKLGEVTAALDRANQGLAKEFGDDPLTAALAMIGDLVGSDKLSAIAAIIAAGDEE